MELQRQGSVVVDVITEENKLQRQLSRKETIARGRTSAGMPIPPNATPEQIAKLEERKTREAGREYIDPSEVSASQVTEALD